MPQFAGEFQAGALLFRYGPYDDVVLSDGPKAYWPLDSKAAVTYDAYDTSVAGDTPKAYWPLDSIDTV
jgi:hypothetical protein